MQRAIKSCQSENKVKSRRFFQKPKSTEQINQAPGNLPGACAVHRLRRCTADDGVNPMETVRLMLYRFLFIILVLLIFIIGNYSINIKIVVRTEGRVDCRPQAINIRTLGRPFFIDGRICIRPCLVAFR